MDTHERELLRLQMDERQARADGLRIPLARSREHLQFALSMRDDDISKAETIAYWQRDVKSMEDEIEACLRVVSEIKARLAKVGG